MSGSFTDPIDVYLSGGSGDSGNLGFLDGTAASGYGDGTGTTDYQNDLLSGDFGAQNPDGIGFNPSNTSGNGTGSDGEDVSPSQTTPAVGLGSGYLGTGIPASIASGSNQIGGAVGGAITAGATSLGNTLSGIAGAGASVASNWFIRGCCFLVGALLIFVALTSILSNSDIGKAAIKTVGKTAAL